MLLQLPTFNAVLSPCPVSQADFTAHSQGSFCGQCQRVVHDFSRSANPGAALAAARAASPDGRVCGSFGRGQVVPALTRRRRWFLLALVLVVGQGLTARQALAQVRRQGIDYVQEVAKPERERLAEAKRDSLARNSLILDEASLPPFLGMVVEQVPSFRGGGVQAMANYIQKHTVWPTPSGPVEKAATGRLFVTFTVGADGLTHNAKVVRGISPPVDAAVLKTVQEMVGFEPGRQNGHPVSVDVTLPVSVKLK